MFNTLGDDFTPVNSGHMDGAKYDQSTKKMQIRYKNGAVYEVSGIEPEHFEEFMAAPSQGEHYHKFIKTAFPVERVS